MTVDYKALLQQKAELEAKIAQALAAEKAGVLARVRSLVADYKLSAEVVFAEVPGSGHWLYLDRPR